MIPSFDPEHTLQQRYGPFVAGVDEVGRGPLAGPVLAAAVLILDEAAFACDFAEVQDSKALTKPKREALFERLKTCPYILHALGEASVQEIDTLNIRQATFLAMRRALKTLNQTQALSAYLVDGNALPYPPGASDALPGEFLIKGDAKSCSIATASILAKVTRDRLMADLAKTYPAYAWEKNAGYGTAAHIKALKAYGATPHHRRSFAPVRSVLEGG